MSGRSAHAKRGGAGFCGTLLVDAHVHFYDCYDRVEFFEGAFENFRTTGAELGLASEPLGCVLFSEAAGDHFFRRLRTEADTAVAGPWTFQRTGEDCSLIATRDGGQRILLFAGRQIATAEDLEVLALAVDRDFPDGVALQPTLDAVLESGAIAVLPWGFGKWSLRRGELMAQIIGSIDPVKVHLGDNGGRPGGFPPPRLFSLARRRNIKILPGTDPLPFASEAGKAGGYGFVLDGELGWDRPAEGLKRLLRAQGTQPRVYGRLESLGRFCRHQVMMQLRKRVAR